MARERDPRKAERARVMLEPADEPTGTVWRPIDEDELPARVIPLAMELGATLGKTVTECRWFRGIQMPSRFLCLHLVAWHRNKGVYSAAGLETIGGLVAAMQKALAKPILDGNDEEQEQEQEQEQEEEEEEEEEEEAEAEPVGEHGAGVQPKLAHIPLAQWAVVLLMALLAFRAAPTSPIGSLATAVVQPFSGAMPACFQRKGADGTGVTAGWPAELRQLEMQDSLEDATALLTMNDTQVVSGMANTVLRATWASKDALATTCSSRAAAIRQELAAELEAISAGVQAGQPLHPEPVSAAMKRGNKTLDELAASCAARKTSLDEEIKRITLGRTAMPRSEPAQRPNTLFSGVKRWQYHKNSTGGVRPPFPN
ncbi:hypothetical protein COHA_010119 [Chlorella ohadii]|uniref:Uncharacterized protein n=1 Tax=Chlorella ohadii TaxID=2649997 RepID=A0AAD5DDE2_9CHLO|nr:hypothetical protein COHA_010119 [Chlorella ohadii]